MSKKPERAYGRKNRVKIDPLAYNIGLIGESGIGKTTIVKEVCEKLVGEDGYMFLICGKEDGADAIEGITYEECPDYETFDDITLHIIENKTTLYPDLRVVVIDTYDQLMEIAEPAVIDLHNNENPDKPVRSIKQAFGGFMGGEDKAIEIVLDRLWELKKVGVVFIIVGHTKKRELEDPVTGQTYSIITNNMPNRYFNAIRTKLHFLGVASIDREIVKEKTGKKNIVTKKDEIRGSVVSESRKITFRDDTFSIDSKSRFAEIVESVPFDPDLFITALEDAIKAEQSKSGVSFETAKKEQQKEAVAKEKEVAVKEAELKTKKELQPMLDKITEYITANKTSMSKIKPIIDLAKDKGYPNPIAITNIDDAQAVLDLIEVI